MKVAMALMVCKVVVKVADGKGNHFVSKRRIILEEDIRFSVSSGKVVFSRLHSILHGLKRRKCANGGGKWSAPRGRESIFLHPSRGSMGTAWNYRLDVFFVHAHWQVNKTAGK